MPASSRLLTGVFLLLACCAAGAPFIRPGIYDRLPRSVPDFGHYYVAAHANRHGDNPYDFELQTAGQKVINPDQTPIRPFSGPWAFGLIRPFTYLEYPAARLAWLFVEIALLIACGSALWNLYGGGDEAMPLAWLATLGGYAGLQSLLLGQMSPLILGGLVGFIAWYHRRPMLAGICLSLLIIKPQNQLVLILIGTIWMIDRRQWRIFLGILLGTVTLTALAMAGNPSAFSQYLQAMANNPPSAVSPPLPGSFLRYAFGIERYWLSFLPIIIGSIWGVGYYVRHRASWNWTERFPLILLVSYLASPYGWAYDQIVFLFAFFHLAAILTAKSKTWWIALLGIQAGLTVYYLVMLKNGFHEFHWVWVAPVQLVLYLVAIRFREARSAPKTSHRGYARFGDS